MTETYHQRLQRIKSEFPRAYERWSEEDERQLTEMVLARCSVWQISHALQRQPSAIKSRASKLGLTLVASDPPASSYFFSADHSHVAVPRTIGFSFRWTSANKEEGQRYQFPEPITPYMNRHYRHAAIYRWLVYDVAPDQPESLYIGCTKKLCPDRLDGYLNPQQSATNARVAKHLHGFLIRGYKVYLEILELQVTGPGNTPSLDYDIANHSRRIVLEQLLIQYYREQGITLLNL